MIITIVKSPWPQDYEDEPPPWRYKGEAFKNWTWEVLLDMGKIGPMPKSIAEAINIAIAAGYEIEL